MKIQLHRKKTLIERLLHPLHNLLQYQSTSGIIIFICVAIAMAWANINQEAYHAFWNTELSLGIGAFSISEPFHIWINDALMAVFFFGVGLEIKRELMGGELSSFRKAILPIGAAFGGMIIPALIYLYFNAGSEAASGWGVPMATDIAFSIGILSLLGKRVPLSLKVFLTALAIVDDIGGVLVIALFYTSDISNIDLVHGAFFLGILTLGNIIGIRNQIFYSLISIAGLWLAFFFSGVHPTIAGILAAFTIPGRVKLNEDLLIKNLQTLISMFKKTNPIKGSFISENQLELLETIKDVATDAETPLQKVEYSISPFIAFLVLPLFALANTGIHLHGGVWEILLHPVSMGIGTGLIIGKIIGIVGVSKLMVWFGLAELPSGVNWDHIYGIALLAGVGFTMSLFISELAFTDDNIIYVAKIGILLTSLLAGVLGFIYLKVTSKTEKLELKTSNKKSQNG